MKRQSHNHGLGGPCREHPVGACLVVIDPNDREQVRRLIRAMDVEFDGFPRETVTDRDYADMQAALRSLIAPPKPEEPLGLGAVVEDAEGVRWTRVEPGSVAITRNPWYPADDDERQPAEYDEINVVRILSGGVA